MGYIILNTDREDEMEGLRSHMRRGYMRHDGTMPYMRHESDSEKEHYYKMGYRHAVEDMGDDEHYRRARDSKGRFI